MKIFRWALLLVSLPAPMWAGYGADPDSGLFFNDSKYHFVEPTDAKVYHGLKTALLINPEDIPERNHYSNSNMAWVELYEISPGGGARPYMIDDFREQVFIVLKGEVAFSAGDEVLRAHEQQLVFIPPGILRGFTATGNSPARLLQADWLQKGPGPEKPGHAFLTSENIPGTVHPTGQGYMTVTPNPRQHGNPLSILSYGVSHINLVNDLLLDFHSYKELNFTANTNLASIGLTAYYPKGGTRWHFHTNMEQVFVIISGRGLFEIGANTLEVVPGDIVFAPRHVGHGYMTVGDKPLKLFELEWARPQ